VILFLQDNGACAENAGRQARKDYPDRVSEPVYEPYPPEHVVLRREDERRTRDGFPIISGQKVMPGPRDTFIAYGRGWANVSNTPFREFKHWTHEGGISTPLIVHAPALIADSMKGKFYREYGQLVDIMTTCVDLAGAKYPDKRGDVAVTPMQGTSLKPALTGKSLERQKPLYWEHEGNRAVRDGKWKLVAKGPAAPWELYDMEADRSETQNLAGEFSDIAEKMAVQWEDWAKKSNVFPWLWAKYQRKFLTKNQRVVPLTGLVFDMQFGEGDLKNAVPVESAFAVTGAVEKLQSTGEFDGKTWITLEPFDSLDCSNIPWQIDAQITAEEPNGVIISHGGANYGYSLYVKDGMAGFAVRTGDGIRYIVEGGKKIVGTPVRLTAVLTADKSIHLSVDGSGAGIKLPEMIQDMPVDPPIIGNDLNRAVMEPRLHPFKGTIKRISLTRGGSKEPMQELRGALDVWIKQQNDPGASLDVPPR
jgi:arylsulfatase